MGWLGGSLVDSSWAYLCSFIQLKIGWAGRSKMASLIWLAVGAYCWLLHMATSHPVTSSLPGSLRAAVQKGQSRSCMISAGIVLKVE